MTWKPSQPTEALAAILAADHEADPFRGFVGEVAEPAAPRPTARPQASIFDPPPWSGAPDWSPAEPAPPPELRRPIVPPPEWTEADP